MVQSQLEQIAMSQNQPEPAECPIATTGGSLPEWPDIRVDISGELRAYREGGVTEEIRCAIVLLAEFQALRDLKNNLRACPDPISRDRADHLAPSETEYCTHSGIPHGTFTCENCGLIARWELSASERMEASRELA